jgi:hypothetical protein
MSPALAAPGGHVCITCPGDTVGAIPYDPSHA